MSKMRQVVLAGAMALGLISVAEAGDRKKYPAFMCEEAGSVVSGTINKSEYRITRTGGTPGTTAQILCPIVRDVWDNSSWGGPSIPEFNNLKMDVLDVHDTMDLYCTAVARDPGGGTLYYNTQHTTGENSNVQQLVWPSSGGLGFASYYYIKCDLPTNSDANNFFRIHSYEAEEAE
jgi:hypothetical protein